MNIKTKKVYDNYSEEDGFRVLVDRLWPRGIKKEELRIDLWAKEIAPSNELRKWYSHDPSKWEEFKRKYREELEINPKFNEFLNQISKHPIVTLLYSSKETRMNNATVLKEIIEEKLRR
jgi:uncharacterized protein YeaO (DUF488 family)